MMFPVSMVYAVEDVQITGNSATPSTIDPTANETMTINYCLNVSANVSVGIYQAVDNATSKKVVIFSSNVNEEAGCHTKTWDGKNGVNSEIGAQGTVVADGRYFYYIHAQTADNTSSDYKSDWVYVASSGSATGVVEITDVEIANAVFSPWDGEEAEITFVLNQDARVTFVILDEDGEVLVTLASNKSYSEGENTVSWDGRDDSDDILDEGDYTYKITAEVGTEKDTKTGDLTVERNTGSSVATEDPRLRDVYATKVEFDPGRGEVTYIVYTLTARADAKVAVYDWTGAKIEQLVDEQDQSAGTYKIAWYGNDVEDKEGTYTYEIFVENSKGDDIESGSIEVKEDVKDDEKKPNIYQDEVDISNIPFAPKNNQLNIGFKMEVDADVTVEIRDGRDVLVKLIEETERDSGLNEVNWNGKDDDGDYVTDGVYSYKLIADNLHGKDTEWGYFSVVDTTNANNVGGGNCAGFSDVDEDHIYCEAIDWAKGAGVFQGYSDGSFGTDIAINRVESLKTILVLLDISISDSPSLDAVFTDIDRHAWYMPVLKSALALGIVHGYPDNSFRPASTVNRIEALVMLMNAARSANGLIIPSNRYTKPYYDTPDDWYLDYVWMAKSYDLSDNPNYFYPDAKMSRSEMADLLYRFHVAGLDR